jgi:hypothetical protein
VVFEERSLSRGGFVIMGEKGCEGKTKNEVWLIAYTSF